MRTTDLRDDFLHGVYNFDDETIRSTESVILPQDDIADIEAAKREHA